MSPLVAWITSQLDEARRRGENGGNARHAMHGKTRCYSKPTHNANIIEIQTLIAELADLLQDDVLTFLYLMWWIIAAVIAHRTYWTTGIAYGNDDDDDDDDDDGPGPAEMLRQRCS